jgi:membrane protease YdiL (CAAX protease family)
MATQPKKTEPPKPSNDVVDSTLSLLTRFQRFGWDILGVILLAASLMTLISVMLPQYANGTLISTWGRFLRLWLGWGGILVAAGFGIAGLFVLRLQSDSFKINKASTEELLAQLPWGYIFALIAAAFAGLTSLFSTQAEPEAGSGIE